MILTYITNIHQSDEPTVEGFLEWNPNNTGAIALSYPPRVRFRATVKLSAVFFHDESSITIGGYESAIAS